MKQGRLPRGKRFFAAILAAVMTLCLLPTGALATQICIKAPAGGRVAPDAPGIRLDAGGLKKSDTVYLGTYTQGGVTYDVPWRVLSKGMRDAHLLSEYLLGASVFANPVGYYRDGLLHERMDELYNGDSTLFTQHERGAIMAVKSLNCVDGGGADENSPPVANAHLYPLSRNDADNPAYFANNASLIAYFISEPSSIGWWWLRSSDYINTGFCVDWLGNCITDFTNKDYGVRPAFHLDLSSVLFTSAAVGGKASGTVGPDALLENAAPSGTTAWKLTLLDASRNGFSGATASLTATSATVHYQNAKTGANEYISAMIVDRGDVTYYGRVKHLPDAADASGTVTVHIPKGVTLDRDTTLRIFNEQCNGDRSGTEIVPASLAHTDLSSALVTVAAAVSVPAAGSPAVSYPQGSAAQLTVTLGAGVSGLRATDNYGGVHPTSELRPDLGTVGRPGRDGKVEDGSIRVTLYESYLNTLAEGAHTLRIRLRGNTGYPAYLETQIIVTASEADVPKTGDSAVPYLWAGLIALAGAGLLAFRKKRKPAR